MKKLEYFESSLGHLAKMYSLSIRACNICEMARLTTIEKIVQHFNLRNSFLHLRGAGQKTNQELIKLCHDYLEKHKGSLLNKSPNEQGNMTMFDLAKIENISNRALNVCLDSGIQDVNQLLTYYGSYGKFKNLKNCGLQTNRELNDVCDKYQYNVPTATSVSSSNSLMDELSEHEIIEVFNHYDLLVSTLSVRSKNVLDNLLVERTLFDTIRILIETNFHNGRLKNIGSKSRKELISFQYSLIHFTRKLRGRDEFNIQAKYDSFRIAMNNGLQIQSKYSELEFEDQFVRGERLQLFALIKSMFASNLFWKGKTKEVFNKLYYIESANEIKYADIGKAVGISAERVRQIHNLVERELQNQLQFLLQVYPNNVIWVANSISNDLITFSEQDIQTINSVESTQFGFVLMEKIFSMLLLKSHIRLNISTPKEKPSSLYYLLHSVNAAFDFDAFFKMMRSSIEEIRTSATSINLTKIMLPFFNIQNTRIEQKVIGICVELLAKEYILVMDQQGNMLLEPNTKKKLVQIIEEIMEREARLLSLSELSDIITIKFPERSIQAESIRSIVLRHSDIFISIGRTSTYGLKKWEQERTNLKGGTIRTIVENFLKLSDNPLHISEIETEVLKYRNTNKNSIITNLKLHSENKFLFFPGAFIGLSSKVYGLGILNFKNLAGSISRESIIRKYEGWDLDVAVDFIHKKYGVEKIQAHSVLKKKIIEGIIELDPNNYIRIRKVRTLFDS